MSTPDAGVVIQFRNVVYRSTDGQPIINTVSLCVHSGELLVLLGRSGSGKTTVLKLVNALLPASEGHIAVEGHTLQDWDRIQLRRRIGYAIQEVGLLPHLTIERNIGLVPQLAGWPRERIRARVSELMQLLSLPQELRRRYPHELSGGQRQRVGLARALAADPPILLMDEPFGALDPLTRAEVQHEFSSLQRRLRKTVMFVTHDVREAFLLGTRIALMDSGRLLGAYSPEEFVQSPDPLAQAYTAILRNGDAR
jgi:osmoprotectant transport system ATP-binding protein